MTSVLLVTLALICNSVYGQVGPVYQVSAENLIQIPANLFDLEGKTIRFSPTADLEILPLDFDQAYGNKLSLSNGIGEWYAYGWRIDLPFNFTFSGQSWNDVYVNVNGNISFGQPEIDSWGQRDPWADKGMRWVAAKVETRSLAGLENMIAVLWANYGRTNTVVYVKSTEQYLLVTWEANRNSSFFYPLGTNLFQAKLFPSGQIELSYKKVPEQDGFVGIFPGESGSGDIDLSSATGTNTGNIYEIFHYPRFPMAVEEILQKIYKIYPPSDDFVFVMLDFRTDNLFDVGAGTGPINVPIYGLGPECANPRPGTIFNSDMIQASMSPVFVGAPRYAETASEGGHICYGFPFAVTYPGHEYGHRWVTSHLKFRNPVSGQIEPLVDRYGHWLPGLNTSSFVSISDNYTQTPYPEKSTMGGNAWQDNGDGTFTRLNANFSAPAGYSALDLYAMGLLPVEEVPETYLLTDMLNISGNLFSAQKVPVRIEDVVTAMGPRSPASVNSQKKFTTGVYLVHEPDRSVYPDMLARAEKISAAVAKYFSLATDERMEIILSDEPPITEVNFHRTFPADSSVVTTSDSVKFGWSIPFKSSGRTVGYTLRVWDQTGNSIVVTTLDTTKVLDFRSFGLQPGPWEVKWRVMANNGQDTTSTNEGIFFIDFFVTSVQEGEIVPSSFELMQNYPNPFNPSTTISFALPQAEDVNLSIYNLRGQLIQALHLGPISAGHHNVIWDGKNSAGTQVSSGIYVYRLRAGSFTETKKMILTK